MHPESCNLPRGPDGEETLYIRWPDNLHLLSIRPRISRPAICPPVPTLPWTLNIRMSYNPVFEASKALPLERIAKELEDFAAAGQDLSGRRFSRSPPPVPSIPSTEYEESEPPSPGTVLRDKESKELGNSDADHQYAVQIKHEVDRIHAARGMGLLQQPNIYDWEEAAEANVRYRWIQQGIWDERWDTQAYKIWKHELQDPLLPERPSMSVKDAVVRNLGTQRKRQHQDFEDKYQESLQSAVEFQNRQSSRPCYQFVYQFCEERQWIKMGFSKADQDQDIDLDTKAYESLKSRWIRDGIWDDDWTLIPGVSWRHERPSKIPPLQETFRRSDACKAARMEEAERPPDWYFMAPVKPPTTISRHLSSPGSLKRVADPSGPITLDSISQVMPPRCNDSAILRMTNQGDLSRSTRQSINTVRQNKKSNEHDERLRKPSTNKTTTNTKRTKNKGKPTQKEKVDTPRSFVAGTRSVKKQNSIKEEKYQPSIQLTKGQKRITNDTSSRPRRAAASEAIKKLKNAI